MKLRKGNVFTRICLFTGGGGITGKIKPIILCLQIHGMNFLEHFLLTKIVVFNVNRKII